MSASSISARTSCSVYVPLYLHSSPQPESHNRTPNDARVNIPQSRRPKPIVDSSSDTDTSDTDTPTPSQIALAAKLGGLPRSKASQQDFSADNTNIPDPKGLARQTGDDGAYGSPRKAPGTAAKCKSRKPSVKGSAKYVKGSAMESLKRQRQEAVAKRGILGATGATNGASANGRKKTPTSKERDVLASSEV